MMFLSLNSNMTGVTNATEIAYFSRSFEFTPACVHLNCFVDDCLFVLFF